MSRHWSFNVLFVIYSLLTFTCSKLTIESCQTCSKLTTKTPERRENCLTHSNNLPAVADECVWTFWRRSGVFIVNFEHISHVFLVFLLLLWTSKCLLVLWFRHKQNTVMFVICEFYCFYCVSSMWKFIHLCWSNILKMLKLIIKKIIVLWSNCSKLLIKT